MKKFLALAVCLGIILSVPIAYAAPVGNIATPSLLKKGVMMKDEQSQWGVIAGPEVDLTWNRHLKYQDDDTEYYFYGGKVGLLLMDRFIPYTILGAAKAKRQTFDVNENANKVQWETNYDFVWGAGGTVLLYSTEPGKIGQGVLSIGIDGRFRQSHLSLDGVVVDGTTYKVDAAEVTASKYELLEWQAAFEVAYQYKQIVPYVGVKYSDAGGKAQATINGNPYQIDFEGKDNCGIFVGGDIIMNDYATLNVEGRFIDETALSLAGTIRF